MSIYGNYINENNTDDIICTESFSDTLELIKKWKTSNQAHAIQVFKSNNLTTEEYEKLIEIEKTLRAEDVQYPEYKSAFEKLCRFCHVVPRGVIITKLEIKKGKKENDNSIYMSYSYNTKKIKLPEDTKLYHMTLVDNIKELIPQFKGKSQKGYLYDKPRIYFTIRKHMPKFLADYKATDKMHKYECKENIKDVYVDPLVWVNSMGAVYVEINKPVKVEEMGIGKKDVDDN